jgi:hypothetical protein
MTPLRTLDVVELPDGRLATILELMDTTEGKLALVEVADERGATLEVVNVPLSELLLYAKAPF